MPQPIPDNPRRVDLHLHSTASDGLFPPAEVVQMAHSRRLDIIALTDHDSSAGLAEAQAAGEQIGVVVLAGVELGVLVEGGEIHMLGYCFDPAHDRLQRTLNDVRNERLVRAEKMVAKLAALGAPISLDRVLAQAAGGAVGRPHVARVLIEAGHAADWEDAFARFLGDDAPAFVPRERLTAVDAIALLHEAGGVAVLAHPVFVPDHETLLPVLAAAGLDGVETYYPEHPPSLTARLKMLARDLDLILTGGSDFHFLREDGHNSMGSADVPPGVIAPLLARAARYGAA